MSGMHVSHSRQRIVFQFRSHQSAALISWYGFLNSESYISLELRQFLGFLRNKKEANPLVKDWDRQQYCFSRFPGGTGPALSPWVHPELVVCQVCSGDALLGALLDLVLRAGNCRGRSLAGQGM